MAVTMNGMKTTVTDSNGTRTYQNGNVISNSPSSGSSSSYGSSVPSQQSSSGTQYSSVVNGHQVYTPASQFKPQSGYIPAPQQTIVAAAPNYSTSALSGGVPQYQDSAMVGVRNGFENNGYKVDWKPSTESVVLTDPNGGSTTLNKGDYQLQNNQAYIPQDKFMSIIGQGQQQKVVPPLQNYQNPYGMNQDMYSQIQKNVQDRINAQIQQRQAQANAQIQSYQQAFNNNMQTIRDNRVLENLQFERNNNPFSGGSDYRRALMDRQRTIADSQAQQQLNSQVGQIQQGLNDYINNSQSQAENMIQDQVNQERNYQLQLQQLGLQQDKFNWDKQYQQGQLDANANKIKSEALQNQIKTALDILDKVGVATPEVANLLGVPVGTPSYQAKEAAAKLQYNLAQLQETQNYHNQTIGLRGQELQNAIQRTQNSKDYNDFLKEKGIKAETAKENTNREMANILQSSSYDQGIQAITENAEALTNAGVNVSELLSALGRKFNKQPDILSSIISESQPGNQ